MKKRDCWTAGIAIWVGLISPTLSFASDACADLMHSFSVQEDTFADVFSRIRSNAELCKYERTTVIPAERRMLADIEGFRVDCKHRLEEIALAKKQLAHSVSRAAEVCH